MVVAARLLRGASKAAQVCSKGARAVGAQCTQPASPERLARQVAKLNASKADESHVFQTLIRDGPKQVEGGKRPSCVFFGKEVQRFYYIPIGIRASLGLTCAWN